VFRFEILHISVYPLRRKPHAERRAAVLAGALRLDRTAVELDEVPHNREADAEPAEPAGAAALCLAKPLEDMRQKLGDDADAVVGDRELDILVISPQADPHLAAVGRELDRVREQI